MDPREAVNRVIPRCDSTNDLARALGDAGYSHGTWVSAKMQDQGRGRLGREWKPVEGNLFLSVVLRPASMNHAPWIPLAAAVAVARAVESSCGIKLGIKWPNDLWCAANGGPAKCGGILCEGVGGAGEAFIVAGIGLNCVAAPEGVTDQRVSSLSNAAGHEVSADSVRMAILNALLREVDQIDRHGTEALRAAYLERSVLKPGTQIEWSSGTGAFAGVGVGKVLGLGAHGELRVITPEGAELRLLAEDVKIKIGD